MANPPPSTVKSDTNFAICIEASGMPLMTAKNKIPINTFFISLPPPVGLFF